MEKKEQILEVAEELFARHGFEGTSVRELAKKAGINIAMISYYFGSKEKLFEELVEYRAGFMRERLQMLSHDEKFDPMTKIGIMIDFYVERIVTNNKFSRILHRELSLQQRSEMHSAIADILLRNLYEIRKIINDGVRKKIFKKVDAELVIATIIGTLTQATHSIEIVSKILNQNPQSFSITDTRYKNRLKKYLRDLMRSYLLIDKSRHP
ncbi:MAG: TetR family transcriptional regulator [Chitinophagales bacterium]